MARKRPEIGWRCTPYGEAALLVEAIAEHDLANRAVLALAAQLDVASLPGVLLIQPALASLLVGFEPLRMTHAAVEKAVRMLLNTSQLADRPSARVHTISVRYGGADGPDLIEVARLLHVTPDDVIDLHADHIFRVLMLGFAPGFPYIGPLPQQLSVPRRATPRTSVPAGSVAIAAGMTGIYPQQLPGGWHIIGTTDVLLFDPRRSPPALLQSGDQVIFLARRS